MTRPLPAAVRKELLIARGAVERAELRSALERFRQARAPIDKILGFAADTGRSPPLAALMSVFTFVRGHPLLGSAVTVLLGSLRRGIVRRWSWRVLAAGLAAGGALWLLSRPPPKGRSPPSGPLPSTPSRGPHEGHRSDT